MNDTNRENKLKAARLFVMTESAQTVAEHIVNLTQAWEDCQKRIAEYEQAAATVDKTRTIPVNKA